MTARTTARLVARVVVVELPEIPGRPGSCLPPRPGFENQLMARWVTLRDVEGPLINGTIALTWEDDPSPDDSLVAHSAKIIDELLPGPRIQWP